MRRVISCHSPWWWGLYVLAGKVAEWLTRK